jgi:hypothetical protein
MTEEGKKLNNKELAKGKTEEKMWKEKPRGGGIRVEERLKEEKEEKQDDEQKYTFNLFGMQINDKHIYLQLFKKLLCMLSITNMMAIWMFEVIS